LPLSNKVSETEGGLAGDLDKPPQAAAGVAGQRRCPETGRDCGAPPLCQQ